MHKEAFLAELGKQLKGLPQDDLEERLAFYSELIDERMQNGMAEADAVAGIGPVDAVVAQILSEIPLTKLIREKETQRKSAKSRRTALLVLGAPVWLPLLLAAAAVLLSADLVLWVVVLCLWTADLSLAAGAIGCFISLAPALNAGNPPGALLILGAGLACAGLAILLFFGCVWITRGVLALTGRLLTQIKASFVGKEG